MAIAFVGAGDLGNATATSLTSPYTVGSGANRLLVIAVIGAVGGGADDITSVTYNAVPMSLAVKNVDASISRFLYLYYLVNPASGANNAVVSSTSSHYLAMLAADYSGVAQTGQPDAINSGITGAAANTVVTTVTTVADNCWAIMATGSGQNGTETGTVGGIDRVEDGAFQSCDLHDNNTAKTPAGVVTITPTFSLSNSVIGWVAAAFAPPPEATLFAQACM